MYAGTNYGRLLSHPLMAYHLDTNPSSRFNGGSGMGFAVAALPAVGATGPAAPFVAAALVVAPFIAKLLSNTLKGCGDSCVLTSDAANEVERLLQKNLAMYQASGHTKEEQEAALAYFDTVWNHLVEFCGQPQFQTTAAGRNCVNDRKRGACKWKNGDVCWNWFIGYRDPIENDPGVKENAPSPSSLLTGGSGGDVTTAANGVSQSIIDGVSGMDKKTLLLIAAVVGLVWVANS